MIVSVWMITYNQEKFVQQAIESVLMQKTNFSYELVIGDDDSSDGTRTICKKYAEKHPTRITLLEANQNLGVQKNMVRTLNACKGKYIAMCEGDDYWIDEYKLQKQFDLLEFNSLYSLCYTCCKEINEISKREKICGLNRPKSIDLPYLLKEGWFMRTPTLFFRNGIITDYPQWFYNSYSTDYILHILLANKGTIGKLDDITAVYRRHEAGISIIDNKKQIKRNENKIELLMIIDKYFNKKYSKEIKVQKSKLAVATLKLFILERYLSPSLMIKLFSHIKIIDLTKSFLFWIYTLPKKIR